MFWIDLGLLGITAYRMVSALKAAFMVAEKLALAFLFALGLKSLILFILIRVEIRPFASGHDKFPLRSTTFGRSPEAYATCDASESGCRKPQ